MSNVEKDPPTQLLFPGSDQATGTATELLLFREVPLGGPRAMSVRRALPNKDRRLVGAWCFADAYGPDDVTAGPGMQVLPHPHTGLQTVSWLIAGEVHHRDSLDSDVVVRPGSLNLMTAGHGIAHSEISPADRSPVLHGAQLWVALPTSDCDGAAAFETHSDLPQFELDTATVTVIMGSMLGASSPATTYTPIMGAELALAPNTTIEVPLQADFEHGVLPLTDGVSVAGQSVPSGSILYVAEGQSTVTMSAGDTAATAILLGGEPFEDELVMWWNFVGRTHDDVADARKTWQVERELPPDERSRFGYVGGHDGVTLPAPDLPAVQLRPRPRHRRL